MPGIPRNMHVYYDPPATQLHVNSVNHARAVLTLPFVGNVPGTACSVLVDSGARGPAFLSHACAQRMQLQIYSQTAVRYRVADKGSALLSSPRRPRPCLGGSQLLHCH